jgi:hypothetical protein
MLSFAQKEIFRGQDGAGAQTQDEITHDISEERQQCASELREVTG